MPVVCRLEPDGQEPLRPGGRDGVQPGIVDSAPAAPGPTAGRGRSPPSTGRHRPSSPTWHAATCCRGRGGGSGPKVPSVAPSGSPSIVAAGAAIQRVLPQRGLGASGRARPGRRGRSCRRSARRRSRRRRPSGVVPSGSSWTSPWSHHSQMKPPCSPAVDSIASQYSASVPLLLPIACEYSHMISGWRWRPEAACPTIAAIGGYIGQVTSLARLVAAPSRS